MTLQTSMRQIYWAGALFNAKDLIGNHLLAEALQQHAKGQWQCILPQDIELPDQRAAAIRNQDLLTLLRCDAAVFNFDGAELDPGTVAEFMYAKMLDIPVVILRTDFRHSGDQGPHGDPWNLMCSFYPRTTVLCQPALASYQAMRQQGQSITDWAEQVTAPVHQALLAVMAQPAVMPEPLQQSMYQWALTFPGSDLATLLTPEQLAETLRGKAL